MNCELDFIFLWESIRDVHLERTGVWVEIYICCGGADAAHTIHDDDDDGSEMYQSFTFVFVNLNLPLHLS